MVHNLSKMKQPKCTGVFMNIGTDTYCASFMFCVFGHDISNVLDQDLLTYIMVVLRQSK